MSAISDAEYAILAAAAYREPTPDPKDVKLPSGWNEVKSGPNGATDGLHYKVFTKGNELVISFRGTDEWLGIPSDSDDFDAAIGSWSEQVYLAFKETLKIILDNPGKNVSFTGHSFGGGLASLMAVWFGREATIFDSAPLEKSAFNLAAYIDRYLNDNFSAKARVFEQGYAAVFTPEVAQFYQLAVAGEQAVRSTFLSREQGVAHVFLRGEGVQWLRQEHSLLDNLPNNAFNLLPQPTIQSGMGRMIDLGSSAGPKDMHSMNFLAMLLNSEKLASAIRANPRALSMLFDSDKHVSPSDDAFFATLLNLHSVNSASSILNKFADDITAVKASAGAISASGDIRDALLVAAMERYYHIPANASVNDIAAVSTTFIVKDGGLHLNYRDFGTTATLKSREMLAQATIDYLNRHRTISKQDRVLDSGTTLEQLMQRDGWHIQTGATPMTWTDQAGANDVAVGGTGNDVLNGGGGNDLLFGHAGNDTLTGGAGRDVLVGGDGDDILYGADDNEVDELIGGRGNDTFYAGHGDIIRDEDGISRIVLAGVVLTGGTREAGQLFFRSADSRVWYHENLTTGVITAFVRVAGVTHQISIAADGRGPGGADGGVVSGRPLMGVPLHTRPPGAGGASPSPDPREIFGNDPIFGGFIGTIVANYSTAATVVPRRDPLALDLDGDGIETVGSRDGDPVIFDHDGDGVRTGTGWLRPDDGWLVLDRNGNGTIDSGRELFGVDTIKSNGRFAVDGFDALRDFDANRDGRIDAADAVFENLRIWRDLNQDGISQQDEISSLADNEIVSISVVSQTLFRDLGNGNVQTAAGSFIRRDGTGGASGESSRVVGNLDLLDIPFFSRFTTPVTVSERARSLPGMSGSGQVRDLSEAISLSDDLGDFVQVYLSQQTRQSQVGMLDLFLERWAATSSMLSLRSQADALKDFGVRLVYVLDGLAPGTAAYEEFISRIGIVERFMGFTYAGPTGQARMSPLTAASGQLTVALTAEQIANINLAYDRIKTDVYESMLLQSRLRSYVEQIEFATGDGQLAYSCATLERAFVSAITERPRDGLVDLVEFISAAGDARLGMLQWDWKAFLIDQITKSQDLGSFSQQMRRWFVRFAGAGESSIVGTSGVDVLVGSSMSENLSGNDGDDILAGKGGHDVLVGGAGNDVLDGGAGNDTLSGGDGADVYRFGRGSGTDTISNADSDALGVNADVIELAAGIATTDVTVSRSGTDLILRINGTTDSLRVSRYFTSEGATSSAVESIRFADGTVWSIESVKQRVLAATSGNDELHGYATADTLSGGDGNDIIYGYGGNDTLAGDAGNDSLFGGDGNDTLAGDAGNDSLSGEAGNDTLTGGLGDDSLDGGTGDDQLTGGDGNDSLSGGTGNDLLDGGAGNDNLSGGDGNDTLDGGAGNDTLSGGNGDDIYRFGKGANNDVIDNYDATGTQNDRVVLGASLSEGQIWFRRVGNDLQVLLFETNETLTVRNWYLGSAYRVDSFELADGQRLLENQVETLVSAMAAFAPPPSGQSSLPPNYQASLNSVIAANWN